jgi:hypothetical protein
VREWGWSVTCPVHEQHPGRIGRRRHPASQSPIGCSDPPASEPPTETWDLLWISDSTGSGGTPWQYADHIRADLGVEVEVTDAWTPGLSAFMELDTLRGRNDGVLLSYAGEVDLAQAIREAEVIMVSGHPGFLAEGRTIARRPTSPNRAASERMRAAETWEQYESDLQGIFDEIFGSGRKPVILRTHDWYLPWGRTDKRRLPELCVECSRQHAAIHRAAATRDVPAAGYPRSPSRRRPGACEGVDARRRASDGGVLGRLAG